VTRIGPIQLAQPFCQAGLAGYSDRAMRTVARRHGCPYAVTEALLDVILLSGGQGLRKSIDINDDDHPVAGQVMGSEPDTMARAARIVCEAGYDVIDLNFACPVKKIKNKARGGHMLRDVPRALDVLKAARDALPPHVPTTISLRRGFDDTSQSRDQFYEIVDAAWANGFAGRRVVDGVIHPRFGFSHGRDDHRGWWPSCPNLINTTSSTSSTRRSSSSGVDATAATTSASFVVPCRRVRWRPAELSSSIVM